MAKKAVREGVLSVKILVVDDEPDVEFLITGKFRHHIHANEFQFLFARNGAEALKVLETHPDIHVVLSDINMPEMDGLVLLSELNERYPFLRTIILSAYSDMPNIRTAMNRGAYDFVTKPIDFTDLEATLQKAIRHVHQLLEEVAERKRAEEDLAKYREHLEELITERTAELSAANEHLRQQVLEREHTEKLLQQRNRELALFSQISKMFSTSIELERVLATVLRSVRHLLNISAASFWVCVPETGELICQQAIGEGSEAVVGWRLVAGQGIMGRAAQSGESVLVGDTRSDPRHYKIVDETIGIELRSILSIPFRIKGNVIGVLDCSDTSVNRFTNDDLRLIEPIAAAAAVAVENARLYARAQQEITERKKAEEALRESEEKYRLLFENLKDVFYRIDMTGAIVLVSPSIIQLLGYTDEEIIGLNLAKDVFVYPEQWDELLTIMNADGFLDNFEVLLKRADGSFDWGSASAQFYTDKEGQILGIEGIIRDISVRKQAEAQLLAAHDELQKTNRQLQELNISKDKFFSIISHDLRSPFNVMLGFSQLMDEHFEEYTQAQIRDHIKKLRASAERLYALLENLLTWSRLQRGIMEYAPETIDISDIVQETMELFLARAEQKQIILRNAVKPKRYAYADYQMVSTVLRNLISNALKFTPSRGMVEVSAEDNEPHLEIAVADTGVGITLEDTLKLFRIDTQYTNVGTDGEKGTGLGLSLCKDLVEKNGGTIWVRSEIGKGTIFRFTLPAAGR